MSDNNIENARKILGTPFSGDLPDNALKVRRNLFVVSLISIILIITGAKVDPTSTLFGIKFTDLKAEHIPWGLLLLNIYFFLHYLWYAAEAFMEWRLRLTGMKVAFQTAMKFASQEGDYPSDPRQSTLYNWWVAEAQRIQKLQEPINAMEKKVSNFEDRAAGLKGDTNGLNYSQAVTMLSSIKTDISTLQRQLKSAIDTIESTRIPASLERFDGWFHLSLRTQSLRWILIDLSLPVLLGLTANVLLVRQVTSS